MNAKVKPLDTLTMLFLQYRAPVVPLEDILPVYLPHTTLEQAKRQAAAKTLPFDCLRANSKSGWIVRIADVAKWIDG